MIVEEIDMPIIKAKLPRIPSYILINDARLLNCDDLKIHIKDIPVSQLEEIGKQWTQALIEKALAMKKGES